MFVRGSWEGGEHRRMDSTPYRGIVVKTNDPLRLNRVKVYIPELSNQPFDNWFESHDKINVKSPGINIDTDDWRDIPMFEEICNLIPWAELIYPILGESGNLRYYKDGTIATISDCNYVDGFEVNNDTPLSLETGTYSPAYLYENESTVAFDAFSTPLANLSVKCNPYSYSYRPSKHVNKSKGTFGVPEVGSKVWVFHYDGDLNYPVVMGIYHDYREFTLINDTDNNEKIGPEYPADFDN